MTIGLCSKFFWICKICRYKHSEFYNSSKSTKDSNIDEINFRFVYATRSIGIGQSAGKTFCLMMGLPQPLRKFTNYQKELLNQVRGRFLILFRDF